MSTEFFLYFKTKWKEKKITIIKFQCLAYFNLLLAWAATANPLAITIADEIKSVPGPGNGLLHCD